MTKQCCNHGAGDAQSATAVGLIERPLYAPGLILEDSDLTAAVDYTRSLSRLLFRSLFGCGVICGLTVKVEEDCGLKVEVAPGLALDGCGDPIQLPRPLILKFDKAHDLVPRPDPASLRGAPKIKDFWVLLCGAEKRCAVRNLVCDADEVEGATQHTRARAVAEASVAFEWPGCICECSKDDWSPANRTPQQIDHHYEEMADARVPKPNANGQRVAGQRPDCQERHNKAIDCAPDCGCDSGCECGCCVLLAWVHWFREERAWGVIHGGVRRLIRPLLGEDPIEDQRPPLPAQPAP
jgi:hypothetical protein